MFSVDSLRRQFLALSSGLIYLDSAATTQKPASVVKAMTELYEAGVANTNRGVYPLAEEMTNKYEDARKVVAKFVNASSHEIIFTKSATESINLVARGMDASIKKSQNICISLMEHHSNIVPWQQLSERTGCSIEWIDTSLQNLEEVLKRKQTKLVAITGLSNVLGSLTDLKTVTDLAHRHGAEVLVDASQLAAHRQIDVKKLDIDYLAFSGHKIFGPTGIGVLYGKENLLENLPPFLGGGDMIQSVTTKGYTVADLPRKFEAGTQPVMQVIGLKNAIEWLEETPWDERIAHEEELMQYALKALSEIPEVHILGEREDKVGCISFSVEGVHPHDLTDVLGKKNICLRAGHHCTQPLHSHLGINASARMSFAPYNTREEIDTCITEIVETTKQLQK